MPIRLSVLHPLMHDCDTSPTGYTSALYAAAPRAHSIYWVFVGLVGRSPLARQLGAFFGFCFFFCFFFLKTAGEWHGKRRERGHPPECSSARTEPGLSKAGSRASPASSGKRSPARNVCGSAQRSATAGGVPAPPKVCDALDNAVSIVV